MTDQPQPTDLAELVARIIPAAVIFAETPEHIADLRQRATDVLAPLFHRGAAAERELARRDAVTKAAWGDQADEHSAAIDAAHPVNTGDDATFMRALDMVGARRGKYELVALVNWLLVEQAKAQRVGDLIVSRKDLAEMMDKADRADTAVLEAALSDRVDDNGSPRTWREIAEQAERQRDFNAEVAGDLALNLSRALEALGLANKIVDELAVCRRLHGYVIASTATLDRLLGDYLRASEVFTTLSEDPQP